MKKTAKKSKYLYPVIYEAADEGGYIAYIPSLPGCHTQGDSLIETEKNIVEAIELYIEDLRENREPIPKPKNIYQSTVEVMF